MSLVGAGVDDSDLQKAAIIIAATPAMSIYPVLAQQYGQEQQATTAMLLMTVMSFVTISGLLFLLLSTKTGYYAKRGVLLKAGIPSSCRRSSTFHSESGNLTYGITASWIISGLVLKQRKDTELGMSQRLIFKMLSGKVVYFDRTLLDLTER